METLNFGVGHSFINNDKHMQTLSLLHNLEFFFPDFTIPSNDGDMSQ